MAAISVSIRSCTAPTAIGPSARNGLAKAVTAASH